MSLIESERLMLRKLEYNDLDELMTIWGDAEVMRYCGGAGEREQELKSLKYYIDLNQREGFSPYAVILKSTGQMIGVCGFNPPNQEYDSELMYHFKKNYWGKGYATEAAKACMIYAGKYTKIDRLGASIDPNNLPSKNVLEKLGFKSVGLKWCEATGQDEPYFEIKLKT